MGIDLAGDAGVDAARVTVTPYDQADWTAKLREARARRDEVLEQRGKSGHSAPLIRPDARPPFSPPAGELPPGCNPKMAPVQPEKRWFDPVTDPAPRTAKSRPSRPPERDSVPAEAALTTPKSQPMVEALRQITGRATGTTGKTAPRKAAPADSTVAQPDREKRPGVQVLAAFAMGLGVGVPLASVAWFLVDRSGEPTIVASADLSPGSTVSLADPERPAGRAPQDPVTTALSETFTGQPAAPTPTAVDAGTEPGFPSVATDSATAPSPVLAAVPSDDLSPLRAADEIRTAEPNGLAENSIQGAVADALGQSLEPQTTNTADPGGVGAAASEHASGTALVPTIRPTSRPLVVAPPPPIDAMAGPLPNGRVIGEDSQVRIYAPSRVPSDQTSAIAADLRQSGANVNDPVRTRLTIQDTHVRYYHASDAEEARAIAARVGADARDFTNFSPSPPEGMLELWVAGRGASGPSRSSRSNDPVAEVARDLSGALSRLLSSIPPSDPQH